MGNSTEPEDLRAEIERLKADNERLRSTADSKTKTFPYGGRGFPKGVSGNPGGRAKAKDSVTAQSKRLAGKTRDQLTAIMQNPKSTAAELQAASAHVRAITKGGHSLDFIADRTDGPVVQQSRNVDLMLTAEDIRTMSDDELREIRDRVLAPQQ